MLLLLQYLNDPHINKYIHTRLHHDERTTKLTSFLHSLLIVFFSPFAFLIDELIVVVAPHSTARLTNKLLVPSSFDITKVFVEIRIHANDKYLRSRDHAESNVAQTNIYDYAKRVNACI
jgi:hypothetical protein